MKPRQEKRRLKAGELSDSRVYEAESAGNTFECLFIGSRSHLDPPLLISGLSLELSGGSKSFLKSKIPLCHLSNPHPDEQRPNSKLNLEGITQMHCRRQMLLHQQQKWGPSKEPAAVLWGLTTVQIPSKWQFSCSVESYCQYNRLKAPSNACLYCSTS